MALLSSPRLAATTHQEQPHCLFSTVSFGVTYRLACGFSFQSLSQISPGFFALLEGEISGFKL